MFFQIARRLLGKILIDLRNTREEALSVAELKTIDEQDPAVAKNEKEDNEQQPKSYSFSDETKRPNINDKPLESRRSSFANDKSMDTRRTSTMSEKSFDQDDDEDDKETKYRLDPK